jgi:hypothetical protein
MRFAVLQISQLYEWMGLPEKSEEWRSRAAATHPASTPAAP